MKTRYEELEEEALEFHRKHPEFWDYFVEFTFDRIRRGFQHYSAQHGIFARIRWETDMPSEIGKFKANNNYSAFYARWFMERYPEHDGFFRLRAQTSHYEPAVNRAPLGPAHFGDSPKCSA